MCERQHHHPASLGLVERVAREAIEQHPQLHGAQVSVSAGRHRAYCDLVIVVGEFRYGEQVMRDTYTQLVGEVQRCVAAAAKDWRLPEPRCPCSGAWPLLCPLCGDANARAATDAQVELNAEAEAKRESAHRVADASGGHLERETKPRPPPRSPTHRLSSRSLSLTKALSVPLDPPDRYIQPPYKIIGDTMDGHVLTTSGTFRRSVMLSGVL